MEYIWAMRIHEKLCEYNKYIKQSAQQHVVESQQGYLGQQQQTPQPPKDLTKRVHIGVHM